MRKYYPRPTLSRSSLLSTTSITSDSQTSGRRQSTTPASSGIGSDLLGERTGCGLAGKSDVGWVNLALDGPDAARTALTSLQRLSELDARVILPTHGPIPTDTTAAFTTALRRTQRLMDDPDGAVWYGARRILAYALMIRNGIPTKDIETYLHARAWLNDAAHLLARSPQDLTIELLDSMLGSGAIIQRHGRLHASAEHTPVPQARLEIPHPREWQ